MAVLVIVVILIRSLQQTVYRSIQPSSVLYHSYDPYLMTVRETGINWNTLPPSRRYQLFIGRAPDPDQAYGYRLDYSFHPQSTAGEIAPGQLRAEWHSAGMTLIEESGQRVFIPQSLLTGGR